MAKTQSLSKKTPPEGANCAPVNVHCTRLFGERNLPSLSNDYVDARFERSEAEFKGNCFVGERSILGLVSKRFLGDRS
ncbi:hypothetical protein CLV78_10269 [Aliiruegeria haliotis]|uniref:Uncharacterized protein n=1 Tax=Aliiruegeria haliotis TaxID=1280846 RepID=A0A2T0RUS2_9RHOB|nr:hypothetical protein CLV78_10269 [Aliiruegeria haliotis]